MTDFPDDVRCVAGYIPYSTELAAEAGFLHAAIGQAMDQMQEAIDREFRPWLYPDPNPMPRITLLPWLAHLGRWFQ